MLRLVAESLGESTCEAMEHGQARNLQSLQLTHLREEEEVQVCTAHCAAHMVLQGLIRQNPAM